MAIHLVPFVAGAVIGGLAAYFARDEKLRREVSESAGELSGKVRETAGEVGDKVSPFPLFDMGGLRQQVALANGIT